ncbi:MAG: sulfate adenylyltransferase subunit 2 [Chitinivibrionales bacterium]|nr:sulfate adenylyltransferase subunit 2 [Chitinivibrionales bacterium]
MQPIKDPHLDELESEAIFVLRETVAECQNPVMLYSGGKDSSVLVRLSQKAFFPASFPYPLLHIDTGYKFPEMYTLRDSLVGSIHCRLIVEHYHYPRQSKTIHPSICGRDRCCRYLKTQALLDALRKHQFDAAIGGSRREEEKSRAKERFFSIRNEAGQWQPKNQRPEVWRLYNTRISPGQSIRVFPLNNWTEIDIWRYIRREKIDVVPLYFAQQRKVIIHDSTLIPLYNHDIFDPNKTYQIKDDKVFSCMCRFRTLGCIPCTGAIRSSAQTIDQIIEELESCRTSERHNRLIDFTGDASMEQKKRAGYF